LDGLRDLAAEAARSKSGALFQRDASTSAPL
jgi:hypothetical protein